MNNKIIGLALFGCFCQLGAAQSYPYQPDNSPAPVCVEGKKLVWHDEFDQNGKPDMANWCYEEGFVRNQELQWYQQDNANCANGKLTIAGSREKRPNPLFGSAQLPEWARGWENIEYTSSSINTNGKHAWKFGRFEIRAKIPTAMGAWPAIWTLGSNPQKPWPENGEIDIMEFYRKDGVPSLLANVAWGTGKQWQANWSTAYKSLSFFTDSDPDWINKYHVWCMEWNANSIKLFLDDVLMNEVSLEQTVDPDGYNPFYHEQYLLLNLALGGANGGDPSNTQFPLHYEVDYVRVYQDVLGTYNGKSPEL
ncbi:MAG: glycoside hydrolase family 16 protein [Breznakibacter sp.]